MTDLSVEPAAYSRLRVLVAHNAYRLPGGEDAVVAAEIDLLRRNGHTVIELRRDNAEIDAMGSVALAAQTVWSNATHARARALIQSMRPDVAHIHNTLPLLSPSLHWACSSEGLPVVQTLHNFRLACPQGMFLRDGVACEDCLGRMPWPAVVHRCYRDSLPQTAMLASTLVLHRGLGTWRRKVDRFIALSEFSRSKFIAAGLDPKRIAVKPNFVDDHETREVVRGGFLYVGRLSPEKGLPVLAQATSRGGVESIRVAGSGPDSSMEGLPGVQLLGLLGQAALAKEMDGARALVVPSICYETFGRVVVEAYARGLPVIASRIGSLAELVDHGVTGLLFAPGDADELLCAMRWAGAHPAAMSDMGRAARRRYEERYTAAINHRQLLDIYRSVIEQGVEPIAAGDNGRVDGDHVR